jgi:hypothetical protein
MNKFVTGALALAVAASAVKADPGKRDWLELDSEINTLASSMTATGDYTNIKVLLRGEFLYGKDGLSVAPDAVVVEGIGDDWKPGSDSLSGIRLLDAEVNGGTQIGDVKVRLGFDFATTSNLNLGGYTMEDLGIATIGGFATLQDAYAMWACGQFDVIAGHYKPHITRTNYTDPENLFFLERSAIGSMYDMYDMGIGARGNFDQLSWSVDFMNGDNGLYSRHKYIGRAVWNIGRDPGNYETDPEDAFGAGDDFVGTVGIFLDFDDVYQGEKTDNYGIDGQGTYGQFGFGFEYEFRDDDAGGHRVAPGWNYLDLTTYVDSLSGLTDWGAPMVFAGDSNPWSIFGTYQVNEQFGVGVRYEDLDNGGPLWKGSGMTGDNNKVITLGANMYDVGHNGKIGVNVVSIDSNFDDSTIFTVGYTFGASR